MTSRRLWKPGKGALLGVRAVLPDDTWRYVLLGDELVAFQGGQRVKVDISPHKGEFAVRVVGLVGRRRPFREEGREFIFDPEERADEVKRWEQDEPLPPVHFRVSFTELAFRNTTFAVDEGFFHHNPIPIPVVFTQVGKAAPHKGVRFLADPN